jgi:UDP-galactopyranose mutase
MSRCARERRVFFVEEPLYENRPAPGIELSMTGEAVCVAVPHLPAGTGPEAALEMQRQLLNDLFAASSIRDCILWYYTPMALPFTDHLNPIATVYDCMDELSAFRGAPPNLRENEQGLLARADVVFTGGVSLYEAKRNSHTNVHAFPSSIDIGHFLKARRHLDAREPADQAAIARPRLGFAGVIDERMNMELVRQLALLRPQWQLVLLGPVVKIDPSELPAAPNIHYLGPKKYEQLPHYMAGWDVAVMPFALNESTRYISPTKTPEYLAAGKRVVSTPIRDVVRTYGEPGLVSIAETPGGFAAAVEECFAGNSDSRDWLARVDAALASQSWDRTWQRMMSLLDAAILLRNAPGSRGQPAEPGHSGMPVSPVYPAAVLVRDDHEDAVR